MPGRHIPLNQLSRSQLIGKIVVCLAWAGAVAGFIAYQLVNGSIQPLPGNEWVWAVLALIPLVFVGLPLIGAFACCRELRRRAKSN